MLALTFDIARHSIEASRNLIHGASTQIRTLACILIYAQLMTIFIIRDPYETAALFSGRISEPSEGLPSRWVYPVGSLRAYGTCQPLRLVTDVLQSLGSYLTQYRCFYRAGVKGRSQIPCYPQTTLNCNPRPLHAWHGVCASLKRRMDTRRVVISILTIL